MQSVSDMDKHQLWDDLEGGLELVLTIQGSFVRNKVSVGIIYITVGRGTTVTCSKTLEMRSHSHSE